MATARVWCIPLLLALLFAQCASAGRYHKASQQIGTRTHTRPGFCNGLDCPDYKVVDELGNDVQLRRYYPSTWAITTVDEKWYESATSVGFKRLFSYIVGDNELETKIEMTAPVVTAIKLDRDDDFKPPFYVSFFLPYKYQPHCRRDEGPTMTNDDDTPSTCEVDSFGRRRRDEEVPIPRDDRVRIRDLDEVNAYVLPFDGYALGFRVKRLAIDFFDYLDRMGEKGYFRSMVFVAVYDAPFKVFDRHNEIWVLKKRCKDGDTTCTDEDGGFNPEPQQQASVQEAATS